MPYNTVNKYFGDTFSRIASIEDTGAQIYALQDMFCLTENDLLCLGYTEQDIERYGNAD